MRLQLGATFKRCDGIIKRDITAFKRGHDTFKFTKRVFKADFGKIGRCLALRIIHEKLLPKFGN
jgi:hypothetical protein